MKIGSEFDFGENWKSSQNQQNLILEDSKKRKQIWFRKRKIVPLDNKSICENITFLLSME